MHGFRIPFLSLSQAAKFIDPIAESLSAQNYNASLVFTIKWGLWSAYWWFQGLTGGAIFCIGHDAGHGTLSDYQIANHTIGFIVHTFILTPYWSWRHSHHLHRESFLGYLPVVSGSLICPCK
jgi:omega-6 fatty acid desaturase (delta-12 desaturase)